MGEWYKFKELAGVYYLEYQNEDSGWSNIAVELDQEQAENVLCFFNKQARNKHDFLCDFLKAIKNG